MRFVLGLAVVLVGWPASGPGQEKKPPAPAAVESLLPADSLFYFRYDGYEPHRKAYDKTALARAMKDDLGEFLETLTKSLAEFAITSLKERNPQAVQKLTGNWKSIISYLWRHGIVVAGKFANDRQDTLNFPYLDLSGLELILVLPEGGTAKNRELFLPLLDLLGDENNPVKIRKLGKRTIHEWVENNFRIAGWQEGKHLMVIAGKRTVESALEVVDGKRPNLQTLPLWKNLAGFKDYETDIRGFVDAQKIVQFLGTPPAGVKKLDWFKELATRGVVLSQLGLTSIKNLTFHLGFDRQYQRSTIVLNVVPPEKRMGLMKLVFAPVPFEPAKLPPLPPDAASVRVSPVDWQVFHDVVRQFAKLASLADAGLPVDLDLGVDFPKDILPHLDSTLVIYNAHSEGLFFLGQGVAVKVKDEKKLADGLHKLEAGLAKAAGGGVEFKKQTYRGADVFTAVLPSLIPLAPTYTIHKGWLVLSPFPQAVKGYILRTEGKHEVWKAPALVAEALELAKKKTGPKSKLAAVTVNDPRPTTTFGLSVLPIIGRLLASGGIAFDDSKIPNAQAVTEWQFPGVTLFYDDGHALRWESHTSFEAPADWLIFGIASFAAGF
jgi:hypothetical protein